MVEANLEDATTNIHSALINVNNLTVVGFRNTCNKTIAVTNFYSPPSSSTFFRSVVVNFMIFFRAPSRINFVEFLL